MKLSKTKVTDKGVHLLLRKPLQSLKELDLSYTNITHHSLTMLAEGILHIINNIVIIVITLSICIYDTRCKVFENIEY